MTVLTPPGYVQGGTYTAKLDRVYNTTTRVVADVSTQLRARQGFYTGRAPVYANPSGWDITMSACAGVVANTFASNSGDYELANDGTVQVTLAASSPTLNRQDIIGFQVKDNLFDASGLNTAVPAVIQGANSAGASADPSLPASFIPVLRAVVPAGSTAPTLQTLVRYTTNDGGAIRIDSATHRAELTPFAGMRIWRSDRGWYETHDGTAWRVDGVAICTSTADRDAAITSPKSGQLAVTTDSDTLWQYDGGTSTWVAMGSRLVARGTRSTVSSASTGAVVGVMSLAALAVVAGHAYRFAVTVHPRSTVAGDRILVELRGTTNGTAPTVASPVFAQKYFTAIAASAADTEYFEGTYDPGVGGTFRGILTITRVVGSGSAELYADATALTRVSVYDDGLTVPNTGTNL